MHLWDRLSPRTFLPNEESADRAINLYLLFSLLTTQVHKLIYIPLYWDCYMPMGNAGLYLGLEPIAFSSTWPNYWIGVWTYIHLVSSLLVAIFLFVPYTQTCPRLLEMVHICFCAWTLLRVSVGNIMALALLNIFVYVWPSERAYKLCLGFHGFREILILSMANFLYQKCHLSAPIFVISRRDLDCFPQNVNQWEWR